MTIKSNPWNLAVWFISASFMLTIAACFAQLKGGNVPYLVVANFISLGVIAYLYGVYSQ